MPRYVAIFSYSDVCFYYTKNYKNKINFNLATDMLQNGQILYENQSIVSSNGRFVAVLQTNALFAVIVI